MTRRLPFAFAISAALLASPPARGEGAVTTSVPPLPAESVRLANGLRVLLAPDPSARLVSVVVSYAAGSADDPNGRKGLAHVTERCVGRRTKHIEAPLRALEAAGGWAINARTELDDTKYFETVPPERLETALWVESDRMGYAAGTVEQTLREEREVVRNEEKDHVVDAELASVGESIAQELYPAWHPYSVAADGTADLDRIGPEDVRAFLSTWYSPENATLAIAGRFDRDSALALVKRYFGSLPSVAPPVRPALPASDTPSVLLAIGAPVGASAAVIEWRTPAFGERDDAALDLAATILAGFGNERFERALVATHLATSVSARQRSERRESVFSVVANVAPGVNPGKVVDAAQDVIDSLAHTSTPAEVERARHLWRGTALGGIETSMGRATRLTSLAHLGVAFGPGFDWGFGRYEGLRQADVMEAVSRWLPLAHRVATVVVPDWVAPRRGSLVLRDQVSP